MEGHRFIPKAETKLGRVVCVSGTQVIVQCEQALVAGSPSQDPRLQMGELVRMNTSLSTVFGIVRGLSIPMPDPSGAGQEQRLVELELLGESLGIDPAVAAATSEPRSFQRGVSVFPSLGDEVFSADQEDLALVYSAASFPSAVKIGTLFQDRSLPAYTIPDRLLGRHFALVGTTGAGKSCATALILHAILERHPNAHIVLLDLHNEYARAFGERAEVLDRASLQLPYWLFNFEEIAQVILGDEHGKADREAEAAILLELIPKAKRRFLGDSDMAKHVTVDSPIPYGMSEVLNQIDEAMGRLDRPDSAAPYARLKDRINKLKADSRFDFLFGGIAVRDNLTAILSRIFRVPVDGKPITIFDLSGIPSEVLNVVVSLLCRITFDFSLWSDREVPILLVCEEAHRYAPQDTSLGFEPTKKALSRIAKEGRKYGVSLGLITQRPAELAAGILSQCNTVFAMRMTNRNDRDFVRGALSDSASGLIDFLPSLREAEAIAVGEGVPVPARICFDQLPEERRPLSATAPFSESWQGESPDQAFLALVVDRWRRQRR